MVALFYIAKGECVMANDKDVTFSELEGRDFKEISEITALKEGNEDGK